MATIAAAATFDHPQGHFEHAHHHAFPAGHHEHHQQGKFVGTIKSEQDINPDGSYRYAYETEDGISANEEGVGGVHATGGAAWTSPEGKQVQFSYTADENGYKPVGSDVPEIPHLIARALEYIASHPKYEEPTHYGKTAKTHF